ncbi:hypothetical protein M441DRAFT_62084 [Trichoderma asperellum CBS 433.97]|uniref:Uncharacterized protein n=1 Tax=Trichoderma asperellum (strain ATCC 204424 / CBS 433.97 / NBRC 101777) TaxID=1042311 RepID=A0A2T3YVN2_TRIA4|nr:hypothetical protein M441DRAFT_62084 [Trichoderma asperellum CBS 433.97]PTB36612.1 hypothetical protein M441DRAFT_62084 [Trichoderma asperellum CBS 433.97]
MKPPPIAYPLRSRSQKRTPEPPTPFGKSPSRLSAPYSDHITVRRIIAVVAG